MVSLWSYAKMSIPSWQSSPPPFQWLLSMLSFLPAGAGLSSIEGNVPSISIEILVWRHSWIQLCFSSASWFWDFSDISWTVSLLCVATERVGGVRVGGMIQTKKITGRGAWMLTDLVHMDLQVSRRWFVVLGIWPRNCMRKGPKQWMSSFLWSLIVPWLTAQALESREPGLDFQLYQFFAPRWIDMESVGDLGLFTNFHVLYFSHQLNENYSSIYTIGL